MPRQPSARAHREALDAALQLIGERGIERVSMDAIARKSGVSKATIYKHWENKEALCLDAISRVRTRLPRAGTGDPKEELAAFLRGLLRAGKPASLAAIMPRIVSYAATRPAFREAWRDRMEGPRRARVRELIERAVREEQLRPGVDFDLAYHMLFGPLMYHRLTGAEVPARMPERIVDAFWAIHAR
jgi:AcrR family transcriptional regulator